LCLHQHKTNASSKPLPPFQEGAEAEIETASTPTSKGTSPSTQEASPTRGRFLFYKYLKTLRKMKDQISIDLWEAYNSIYEESSSSGSSNKKPVSGSTSTSTPPVAPRITLNDPADLDALRKASAQATMAGPSREAQALMSTRTKNILSGNSVYNRGAGREDMISNNLRRASRADIGDKLKAGIAGQERVERMKNKIGRLQPKPEASTPASTPAATTGKGIVLAKKDGISGTLNKATGEFTAGKFDKDQEARYTQKRGAEQLKTDASKVLTKNTNPETRQPQPPPPKEPPTGLTPDQLKQYNQATSALQNPLTSGIAKRRVKDAYAKMNSQQQQVFRDHIKSRPQQERDSYSFLESVDLFDYLLEYLVAEGYADTNKAALAIMANMSEEWKQSIVEGVRPGDVETPLDKAAFKKRRRSLAGREASADAKKRGHVDKFTGKPYGTEEAASRRKDIHKPEKAPEREARRKAEEDPD